MGYVGYYALSASDNGSYWTPELKSPLFCCQLCGSKLSRAIDSPSFYLKKKSYDVSSTYDGFLIGSEKFVSLITQLAPGSFIAREVPFDKRYTTRYWMLEFKHVVKIDRSRALPEFGPVCAQCGQHTHIVGARHYFLDASSILRSGAYRTDLQFADGFEKSPVVIVTENVAKVLLGASLRGLTLDLVPSGEQ
jgi:hypothetical protein